MTLYKNTKLEILNQKQITYSVECHFQSVKNFTISLYQKRFIYKFLKFVVVLIANGNIHFVESNMVEVDPPRPAPRL